MVFLIAHKAVQRTVNGVILTRFYFNRNSDQVFVIINQIVHLALIAIVVIEQLASMGDQLYSYSLIPKTEELLSS